MTRTIEPNPSMSKGYATIECLEERKMLAATPVRVTQFYTDNRGQTEVFFNQALNTATLTKKSVRVFKAGADGQFGTADDQAVARSVGYRKGRLVIVTNLPVNTRYRVRLAGIKGTNGVVLAGYFNGLGMWTGNGVAGGNFDVTTQNAAKTRARFTTVAGYMNMALYTRQAPITAGNFVRYANEGAWDVTFFHRSVPGFVVQGGGFKITAANGVDAVVDHGKIKNEPGISNTRGTVAMARAVDGNPATTADRDSATNQWFFNLSNNNASNLDNQEGGFTVFGVLTDKASLRVMDALARYERVNAGSPFNELPVLDADALQKRNISPKADLIRVTRVAMMMDAAATPGTLAGVKKASVDATRAAVSPADDVTATAGAPVAPVSAPRFSAVAIEAESNWLGGYDVDLLS